jgi:hypothetical protein
MRLGVILSLVALTACEYPFANDCDAYVDYLCACEPDACDARRAVFDGASESLQETCRIQLACFDDADDEGGVCFLFDEGREEECAP